VAFSKGNTGILTISVSSVFVYVTQRGGFWEEGTEEVCENHAARIFNYMKYIPQTEKAKKDILPINSVRSIL
jgi:hypothetical protein